MGFFSSSHKIISVLGALWLFKMLPKETLSQDRTGNQTKTYFLYLYEAYLYSRKPDSWDIDRISLEREAFMFHLTKSCQKTIEQDYKIDDNKG